MKNTTIRVRATNMTAIPIANGAQILSWCTSVLEEAKYDRTFIEPGMPVPKDLSE